MNKKLTAIFALIIMSLMILPACSPKGETPEQATTNALNAIRDMKTSTIQKYLVYEDFMGSEVEELGEDEEYVKLIFRHLSHNILSSSIDGETSTVKVEVTNINMAVILTEYFQQAFAFTFSNAFSEDPLSEEEVNELTEQMLVDLLKKDDVELTTSTITIALTKTDSSWKLEVDDVFRDAILGGMLSAMEDID